MDLLDTINETLGLDVEEKDTKETNTHTEVNVQSLSNSVKSTIRTTGNFIIIIFVIAIIWKSFIYMVKFALGFHTGESPFAPGKSVEPPTKVKAEKPKSEYKVRIDKLLENAKDEKEAVLSLKTQVEKLYEKRDQLTGYARAEINKQLTDVGKYIAMFEEVQNERRRTKLNSHAKHVLDKVWD